MAEYEGRSEPGTAVVAPRLFSCHVSDRAHRHRRRGRAWPSRDSGTRMRVTDVWSLLAAGASEAEVVEDYPYLAADDIRACLEYAAAQADHAILLAS